MRGVALLAAGAWAVPALAQEAPGLAVIREDLLAWESELAGWLRALEAAESTLGQGRFAADDVAATLRKIRTSTSDLQDRARRLGDLDPGLRLDLDRVSAAAEAGVSRHSSTLITARVFEINEATVSGSVTAAQGDRLASELLEFGSGQAVYDRVWSVLLDLGVHLGDEGRIAAWGAACAARCATDEARNRARAMAEAARDRLAVQTLDRLADAAPADPEPEAPRPPADHLGLRVELSWTVPLGEGSFEGADLRLGPSARAGVAWAWGSAGCVGVEAATERWRAPSHPGDLSWARSRIEAGWCPELAKARVGEVDLALRPWLALGGSVGRAREAGADINTWGLGASLRADLVLSRGRLSLVPSIGVAPYGRWSTADGDPLRFSWNRRTLVGLGVGWGYFKK